MELLRQLLQRRPAMRHTTAPAPVPRRKHTGGHKQDQAAPDLQANNNTTGIYQNMHTVAEWYLYAWAWTTTATTNGTDMK